MSECAGVRGEQKKKSEKELDKSFSVIVNYNT